MYLVAANTRSSIGSVSPWQLGGAVSRLGWAFDQLGRMDVLHRLIAIPGIVKPTHQPILQTRDPVFLLLMLATKRIAEAPNWWSYLSSLSVLSSPQWPSSSHLAWPGQGCGTGRGAGGRRDGLVTRVIRDYIRSRGVEYHLWI